MHSDISIEEFPACSKPEGCKCFRKLTQALESLPAACTPSLFMPVRMRVQRDYKHDFAVESRYTDEGNTRTYHQSYNTVVFSCDAIARGTELSIQLLIISGVCLSNRSEEDYYQSFLIDRVQVFKEGFEAGLTGECPRVVFEIRGEEEIYEDGYNKGAKAALVRAANRAGSDQSSQ